MRKFLKFILILVLIGIAIAVFLTLYTGPTSKLSTIQSTLPRSELVERGYYLARAGDCISCHTARGDNVAYAGGMDIESPIGTIYASNITPDPTTGIGTYSLQDFDNAVRYGIRKDGVTLYPAMPYPSFANLFDEDVEALYAFFMDGVEAVNRETPDSTIPWPLNMRWPLTGWRMIFSPKVTPFKPELGQDAITARGAYLVQGLGHCGACHTPRAITLQEKSMHGGGRTGDLYLSGGTGEMEGWVSLNLRGDMREGLGMWTEDDIVEFFKTGRNRYGSVFGGMSDVINNSLQYLSDDDLTAMARYLKTLRPFDHRDNQPFVYDDRVARNLFQGDVSSPGAGIYLDACAACHRTSGKGYPGVFPPLAGNPAVLGKNPASVINIVMSGQTVKGTMHAPASFTMPAQGWRYNDQEIADVVSFIRTSWGNNAEPVAVDAVAGMRKYLAETRRETGDR